MMKKYLSIFCLIIAMMAGYAHAGTVYTDRALFEAAVSTYTIEDFEAYPVSGNPGSGAVSQINFNSFSVVHPVDAYIHIEKNGHTPQEEIVRRFPINGGEACPRVFFTMDSALSATIMSGRDMREEVSRSPYATKGANFVVRSVEAGRSSCGERHGDGSEAFLSVSKTCFSILMFSV